MDLLWTTKWAPHCVVLLLILLSRWAVQYASSDLPSSLLMLIVTDISCTQARQPWPLCSGPENRRTLATIKSLKWCNNATRDITTLELQQAICCNVNPISLRRFCYHPQGLMVRYSLYVKGYSIHLLPIYHPCLFFPTPPFIYPSIHLSIHQFI